MSDQSITLHQTKQLRHQAEQLIQTGNAQFNHAFNASSDALAVLFKLSSSPTLASDCLKLLHELQIHQVELSMQLEQMQNNERRYCHELACYQPFFQLDPKACFILTLDGIITDCNEAASTLFGQFDKQLAENNHVHSSESLCGRSLFSLFRATYQPMLSAALNRVNRNQQKATLLVSVASSSGEHRNFSMSIQLSDDQQALLIMLT